MDILPLFHKNNSFQIFQQDCIEKLKIFHKNGLIVDHIITDPPYAISRENNFSTMNSPRKGVDFGEWDKDFEPSEWLDFAYPILDKNGSIIVFCSYRFISLIINKIESLGGIVKDIMVWQKSNPMPRNINRRYVQDMEFIIWAVKSKKSKWIFNKDNNKSYLRGFFQTPTLLGKERTSHPTQKPLSLMQEIIKIHTNENDVILDPFMGTGTTGVAALNLHRQFIGCEKEYNWFVIAQKRLQNLA